MSRANDSNKGKADIAGKADNKTDEKIDIKDVNEADNLKPDKADTNKAE